MYISSLIVDTRYRQARTQIAYPYEMHRTLMNAFPGKDEGGPGRVLFRLESPTRDNSIERSLLVQSEKIPNWAYLGNVDGYRLADSRDNPDITANPKSFVLAFQPGQRLCFRLRANPTKRAPHPAPDSKKRPRLGLYTEAEQRDWLARKAAEGGFTLLGVTVTAEGKIGGKTKERHDLNLLAVRFDGVLQVTDPALFLKTVQQGLGSGKGLGFGLLSLARATT